MGESSGAVLHPLSDLGVRPRAYLWAGVTFFFSGTPPAAADSAEPATEVDYGGELVVPPMSLDTLKDLQPRLDILTGQPDLESMGTLEVAIVEALKRNYRGVPSWLVRQSLGVDNMPEFTQAFMDVNGLYRKKVAEEKKAMAASQSTGTASTAP